MNAAEGIFENLDNYKNPNQRDYCSICVFGDLGKGKSTFLMQFANQYLKRTKDKKVPRKVLICDPSRAAGFSHVPSVTLTELKYGVINPRTRKAERWDEPVIRALRGIDWADPEWFDVLINHFQNGLIIFDESTNYIRRGEKLSAQAREFFTIHRNNAVDVLVISHTFMSLHLELIKAIRAYVVFKTGDLPTDVKWFTQRTLPEGLYPVWKLLQRLDAPSAKMQPFVFYDRTLNRSRLYVADYKELLVLVPDPKNPSQSIKVPYLSLPKSKR